jgi:hypothetical protein
VPRWGGRKLMVKGGQRPGSWGGRCAAVGREETDGERRAKAG